MEGSLDIVTRPSDLPPREGRRRRKMRRHLLLLALSFILPALAALVTASMVMTPEYRSTFSFLVRQQQSPSVHPASLDSVLSGSNPMLAMIEDPQAVVKYIRSHQILSDISGKIDLQKIYASPRIDWFSRMKGNAPRETELHYWRSMISPAFDLSSGIVTVNVRAFTAKDAERVAMAVLASSEALVNRMSEQARSNALAYAKKAVAADMQSLTNIERKMAEYRNAHAVLFPELSANTNSSVQANLLNQLAEATATMRSLESQGQKKSSPQIQILGTRIAAIKAEISRIRGSMAGAGVRKAATLASVMTGYDELQTQKELGLKLYTSDLEALQAARQQADQKQIYLESFIAPNLPQKSTYPEPWRWAFAAGIVGFLIWTIGLLVLSAIIDLFE